MENDLSSINREIGELKEQGRWMAPRVERIEEKLDHLIERTSFNWGKVLGAAMFAAFVATLVVELVR